MHKITEAEKQKFIREVLLNGDDIQEFAQHDKLFRHDAALRLQIRAYMEWFNSPCLEHKDGLKPTVIHGQCEKCKAICWEVVKG